VDLQLVWKVLVSLSSSSINCMVVPGGDGLVDLVMFVSFKSFLMIVSLFGILVLWWHGLIVSWMRYTLSEIS